MKENTIETKKVVVADAYLTPGFSGDMLRSMIDNAENIILVVYDTSVEVSQDIKAIVDTSTTPIFVVKSQPEHDEVKSFIKQSFQEGNRGTDLKIAVKQLIDSHA